MKTWPCKGPRLRRVDLRMEPTPFHEGLWALVGGRFLTSGQYHATRCPAMSGGSTPCCVPAGVRPVTVAGPRRILTGLPLTTDRMNAAILPEPRGPHSDTPRGGRRQGPFDMSLA